MGEQFLDTHSHCMVTLEAPGGLFPEQFKSGIYDYIGELDPETASTKCNMFPSEELILGHSRVSVFRSRP